MVRPVVLVAVAALVLAFLPVERVFANEVAPETKSETLTGLPAESSEEVEVPADASDDTDADDDADSNDASDGTGSDGSVEVLRERSEIMEAPIAFSGLGFTGPGAEAPEVYWRALTEDDTWTDWHPVEALEEFDGPDPGSDEERRSADRGQRWASDAIWVGAATHIQVQVEGAAMEDLEVTFIDSAGLTESLAAKAKRTLMSFGTAPTAEAAVGQPNIRTRADWGADESCTSGTISYATPRASVLHHTATKNDYTKDEVPQQIRNMYHWHTACNGSGNGWNDIGYNFVIDRFGQIWEARRGGIDKGVIGAHAGGWNTGTFGVAIMGNYNTATPSSVALQSAIDLISWKFDIHDIDPATNAWLNGQSIPRLTGHRNVRGDYNPNPSTTTDCPGQNLYERMQSVLFGVEAQLDLWTPVVGDWNGNGQTTVGWYRDGHWRLRNSNSAGKPHLSFRYGTEGDMPVVGDWNGNGQTTVGIMRGSRWLLRNSNSGGAADIDFHYGRGAIDFPMAGDWNGNGRDSPAIVRDGEWHLRNSLSGGPGQIVFYYGRVTRGDIPVVGDWTGNGIDTPGILRKGEWHLRNTHAGGPADETFIYGRLTRGDIPIIGDWNGNGQATIGVTRGGEWHLRNSLSGGPANITFTYR